MNPNGTKPHRIPVVPPLKPSISASFDLLTVWIEDRPMEGSDSTPEMLRGHIKALRDWIRS